MAMVRSLTDCMMSVLRINGSLLKALQSSAFRKRGATPELLTRFRARLHGTDQQSAAAFGAFTLRCGITAALEVLHVFAMSGEGGRAAAGLQGAEQGGDLGVAEDRLLE